MRTLTKIIASTLVGASLLFAPIKSHAWKEYSIEMISEHGEKTQEEVEIRSREYIDGLFFSFLTENYEIQYLSEEEQEIPLPARYTNIHHGFTRVFVLHPPEVKISNIEQRAYIVPQHEMEGLKPLEESPKAQLILEAGETLLHWALVKTGIPFANELFDEFVEYSMEKEEKHYEEIFKKINEEYTVTRIPSFPIDRFTAPIETAREYDIFFDMSDAPKGEVPMSVWIKLALGDPSMAAHGSFPNRYGELENIIINFSLMGEKEIAEDTTGMMQEPGTLEDYFLQGKELDGVILASKKYFEEIGLRSNPHILNIEEAKDFLADSREAEDIIEKNALGGSFAIYTLPTQKEVDEIPSLGITTLQFDSKVSLEKFIETDSYDFIMFSKDNTFIHLEYYGIDYEDEQQQKSLLNCLINYTERINPELVMISDINEPLSKQEFINFMKIEMGEGPTLEDINALSKKEVPVEIYTKEGDVYTFKTNLESHPSYYDPSALGINGISDSFDEINPKDTIGDFAVVFDGYIEKYSQHNIRKFRAGEDIFYAVYKGGFNRDNLVGEGNWETSPQRGAYDVFGRMLVLADREFIEKMDNLIGIGWQPTEVGGHHQNRSVVNFYPTNLDGVYMGEVKKEGFIGLSLTRRSTYRIRNRDDEIEEIDVTLGKPEQLERPIFENIYGIHLTIPK